MMKHIIANESTDGTFIFKAAPIPEHFQGLDGLVGYKTIVLPHSGESYAVIYDNQLQEGKLHQLKLDWENSNPQVLTIVLRG